MMATRMVGRKERRRYESDEEKMGKKLKITKRMIDDFTYDDWLDYFRTLPTDVFLASRNELKEKLPVEGFAAASRWVEIIQNPSKMDKLYSARLKAKSEADIMEIAVGDNDEAFYEALIRENVQQLNTSNISQQEVARLTQNINIFRKELREIRSRKPKKGTVLEKVLEKAAMPIKNAEKSTKNDEKVAKTSKNATKTVKSEKSPKKKASKTRSKAVVGGKTVNVSSGKEK